MRTINEAISELKRELNVRNRCYDRWVADGKLDQIDATDRLERLAAAVVHLEEKMANDKDAAANAMPTDEELEQKTHLKSSSKRAGTVQ